MVDFLLMTGCEPFRIEIDRSHQNDRLRSIGFGDREMGADERGRKLGGDRLDDGGLDPCIILDERLVTGATGHNHTKQAVVVLEADEAWRKWVGEIARGGLASQIA